MRRQRVAPLLIFVALVAWSCSDNSEGPGSRSGQTVAVQLTASAARPSGAVQLGKVSGTDAAVDSIIVDDALIVLKDIKFSADIDTLHGRDSSECEHRDEEEDNERDDSLGHIHFRGPFLVVLQDTTPVQITVDTIPPGTYNGIRFMIHKLRRKDVMRNPALPDSLVGFSIVVHGSVKYASGGWTPFVFRTDIDEDFKVKGNFVIGPGDNLTPYVLKFDLASWFMDGMGRILDPNSRMDRMWIRWAIKASLKGHMIGGRDHDHNGDPDDWGG